MKLKLTAAVAVLFIFFSDTVFAQQGMGVGNNNPLEMLDVTGAIKIGTDINNSNAAPIGGAGTIRFRAGQFEGWDGATWIPLGGGGGNSPFEVNSNLVQPNTSFVTYATDDFIFGSPSLDDDGDTDHDGRFFYDKSKGAFRAGLVTGDQWDDIKRGNQSFAVGYDVTASGDYSMTLGERSWAIATGAIAMGRQAYAEGEMSFAWGNDVQATGEGSVALGRLAFSTADYSYAVGTNVNADAEYSMAVGADANATASYAIALGNNANATAASAFVLGHNSTGSAYEAAAFGYDVNALGEQSIGFGHDLTALSNYEIVLGRYNSIYVPSSATSWVPTDRLFSIGNGTGSIARSNALTILKNGNTGVGTSTPSATLHVDGSLRIVDGNQSSGRVLTSDGSGNATWQVANTGTDNQNLTGATLTGTSLQIDIEDGSSTSVNLSSLVDDADADASNELQTLSQSGTNVTLSNGGGTISVVDNDNDSSNELQTLSVSGADVTLSNGGGTVTVNDGDWTINGSNQYSAVAGNVGVGMTNPASKLHIEGTTTDQTGGFRFTSPGGTGVMYLNSTNDIVLRKLNQTNQLVLDVGGNVGVGTNAPGDELHVEGSVRMVDGNQAAGYIPVSDANGTMVWTDPTTITTAADGDGNSSNELQTLSISGNDITLSNGGGTVAIPNDADWTVSGNNQYSAVSGNVGFGINNPTSKIHVSTNSQDVAGGIRLTTPSANAGIYLNSTNDLVLRKLDRTDQLVLDVSGRVGVGTATPSAEFQVMGSIRMVDGNEQIGYIPVSTTNGTMVWTDPTTIATAADGDGNSSNELQTLSQSGTDITLSNGGGTVSVADNDNDATNEFQDLSSSTSGTNRTINITSGTGTTISVADNDNDSSNELQTLSISGNDITLSNGGGTVSVANDADWTVSGNDQYSAVSGNVGIGISGPSSKLEVSGSESTTHGTGAAIRISNTATGGDAWILRSGATGTETPAGGISLASPSGYHMAINGSGNVGFGTTDPDTKLHVESTTTGEATGIKLTQDNANSLIYHNADRDLIIRKQGQTDQLVLDNGGSVGIGTVTPGNRLHVEGSIRMVDGNQTAGFIPVSDANGKMTWTDPSTITTAADGDGNSSNELQTLSQSGTDVTLSNGGGTISVADNDNSSSNELQTLSISGSDITLSNSGGTVSVPTQTTLADDDNDTKIQVEETADDDIIRFDLEGTERFRMLGPVIEVLGSNKSVFLGENAGLSADPTADRNTAVGFQALRNTTTSSWNTAIGANTLQSITGGGGSNVAIGAKAMSNSQSVDNNVAIGTETLLNLDNSGNNVAIGYLSQRARTAGGHNTSLGTEAMMNNLTGTDNVAIGSRAGRNSTGSGSVFIGRSAGLNETGDNKLYIENSGSGDPLIYGEFDNDIVGINGKLGVGTESPQEELHVEGSIRMVDGNEGAGKVAVSDANGTMSWTDRSNYIAYHKQAGVLSFTGSSNSYNNIAGLTSTTLNVQSGDIITLRAEAIVNFTSGSGSDDFYMRVTYGNCSTGNSEEKIIRFDEDGGHDNPTTLSYLDVITAPCTGTLWFRFQIKHVGDDPWEAVDGVIVATKY